jgi:N-acylneuraminate cytidylyltransferase
MRAIAIIPARTGSKRIPGKNTRDFKGRPIISYPIQYAIASGLFDEVMVSTEGKEVADISLQYGASIPFIRSAKNATDTATVTDVLIEVLEYYNAQGILPEYVCCIYPTSVFAFPDKLKDAFDRILQSGASSLVTVTQYIHPIQRALYMNNGQIAFKMPEFTKARTQDLETMYHDTAQFYWIRTRDFLNQRAIFTSNTIGYVMEYMDCQDIDNESDWKLAEYKFDLLKHPK